jgi:regulatory protein
MRILSIEELDKVRRKIHLEGVPSFWLYRSDIAEYGLKENAELTEQLYELIRTEKVLLYAKKKTLELLERMDRSEQELKNKLAQRDFSLDIIEEAIAYAKKFHYVDDLRFATNLIHQKSSTKSKKQISFILYQKGISKDIADQAYEDFINTKHELANSSLDELDDEIVVNPEVEAILKIVRRKKKPIEDYSKEELQKLTASLYRKGFSMDNIRKVLSCDFDM